MCENMALYNYVFVPPFTMDMQKVLMAKVGLFVLYLCLLIGLLLFL